MLGRGEHASPERDHVLASHLPIGSELCLNVLALNLHPSQEVDNGGLLYRRRAQAGVYQSTCPRSLSKQVLAKPQASEGVLPFHQHPAGLWGTCSTLQVLSRPFCGNQF